MIDLVHRGGRRRTPTHPHRPARARRLAVLGVPLLVLAMAGCSDSGDDSAGDVTTTTLADRSTSSTSTTTVAADDVDQTPPVGANGIKVAADGTLWIASVSSDVILQIDPADGRILRRVVTPAASGPDDVALAPDGSVYWTGYLSGAVGVITPDSDETAEVSNVGSGANPIARRDDGTLVVGRAGASTGLFRIDPAGDATPTPLADPGNLNSFDIAPDGLLYAPSLDAASVLEIDADTGETLRTVATVDGAPIALRVHDDQLFVLVLSDSARVFRVDPATGATEPFADTGLPAADNLAVGEDGRVYVTGLSVPSVTVLGPDGTVERTIQVGG